MEIILTKLTKIKDRYKLTSVKEQMSTEACPFFSPKVGDTVAIHWGHVVKRLTKQEAKNLMYWTKQTLTSMSTQEVTV
jgi:hydrogenase maturation factor